MLISVVIVSFNTKELLKDCLHSLESSTPHNSEIFVVDNASSDGTVSMVKKDFPQIKLIANKKNLGFSKANNLAIKKTKGQFLLVLNPDTKIADDAINKMIKFMQRDSKVGIATCRVELPSGQIDKDCRRHFPTPWRAFCYFSRLSKVFAGSKLFDEYHMGYIPDSQEHEIDACLGAFMIIRKNYLDKVGYFDEDFFFYGEDLDLCYRFKESGFKIMYTPEAKIIHYKGASSGIKKSTKEITKATKTSKEKALKESTRAMVLFYEKHYRTKYPFFITQLVILAIKMLEKIRLATL